jgi:thioredoxin reductase (NADPH)
MKIENYDLVVVGAGPAGLGAAIYAARSALNFIVVEKFMAGGQIVTTELIENYPGFKGDVSGYDLMQNIIEHCKSFKIDFREGANIGAVDVISEKTGKKNDINDRGPDDRDPQDLKNVFRCSGENVDIISKSLIIASGASPKRLFVEGENEFIGKGVSFCATCDGALYRDKEVMVIGGGNTAIQEALFLAKFASKVSIVHRRDSLRAVKTLQSKAFSIPKIEFIWDSVIGKFEGNDHIESVVLKNVKTGKTWQKKVSGVFEYIGIKPDSGLVSGIVKVDEYGFIITSNKMETSVPGIFAAGDVRNTPLRQVITAVADGAIAATYADKYINEI